MARKNDRHFELRHDSAGRAIWYQLKLTADRRGWEPVRVARPARFRAGDKLLDLSADEPTKRTRRGGEWVDVPLSQKALRYWVENRIPDRQRRAPAVQRARAAQRRLIRGGTNPDDIRVFHRRNDGSTRRFTVSSWARFATEERYKKARQEIEEADEDFVLGLMDEDGALGEVIEELE